MFFKKMKMESCKIYQEYFSKTPGSFFLTCFLQWLANRDSLSLILSLQEVLSNWRDSAHDLSVFSSKHMTLKPMHAKETGEQRCICILEQNQSSLKMEMDLF